MTRLTQLFNKPFGPNIFCSAILVLSISYTREFSFEKTAYSFPKPPDFFGFLFVFRSICTEDQMFEEDATFLPFFFLFLCVPEYVFQHQLIFVFWAVKEDEKGGGVWRKERINEWMKNVFFFCEREKRENLKKGGRKGFGKIIIMKDWKSGVGIGKNGSWV